MAESFFGFDTNLERDNLDDGVLTDDDEEDYDALNDETFGGDATLDCDWEQDHEKLAEIAELSKHKDVINENGDLSAKIAAFILDDELDLQEKELDRLDFSQPRPARPPPGFSSVTTNNHHPDVHLPLSNIKKFCTVEEIERNLIKPTTPSLLEDIERNLIAKQNQQQLISLHPPAAFISVPTRHHPLLNNHLPKIPSLPAPFPLPAPFAHPFAALQAGTLRVPPTSQPPTMLRLAPVVRPPIPPPRVPPMLPPADEYAGLMTPKEKQWLAQIQLMQLSTNNPFQDDYYYMMYQHRQSGAHGRKGNVKQSRETPTLSKATYTPLQFENSLGKLQVGSVMAPRKIIDTDVVEIIDCPISSTSSKKIKQILLEIEHLFSSVLLAEEALSPLATSSLENVNPTEIFRKAVNCLLKDDKLRTVLSIRKGKTLILRILPHTDVSGPLAERLISVLPMAAMRDSEQALLRALPAIRHYLATANLQSLNALSTHLLPHLASLLENKLGISVITNMIERAEALLSSADKSAKEEEDWLKFLSSVVSTSAEVAAVERPVVGIQGPVLARHLARLPQSPHASILQKSISNTASST